MKDAECFIRAFHEFRNSLDFTKSGILPELDDLISCMLIGIPYVPADEDTSADAPMIAIDQRVAILKAAFVEVNWDQTDDFLDQGLLKYGEAGKMAKKLLKETD